MRDFAHFLQCRGAERPAMLASRPQQARSSEQVADFEIYKLPALGRALSRPVPVTCGLHKRGRYRYPVRNPTLSDMRCRLHWAMAAKVWARFCLGLLHTSVLQTGLQRRRMDAAELAARRGLAQACFTSTQAVSQEGRRQHSDARQRPLRGDRQNRASLRCA